MAAKESMLLEIEIDKIKITKLGISYYCKICQDCIGYYIEIQNVEDSCLFNMAGVENRFEFQREILGYSTNKGYFPYCKNREDIIKLVKAVVDYNNEQIKRNNVFSLKKRLPIKFNFNL